MTNLHEQRYFTPKQFTEAMYEAAYMIAKYKELRTIDKKFRSNIMMAVTNVNGCRVCSYYHTSELLKAGASEDELKFILESAYHDVENEDTVALMFAEHYADTLGNYDKEAFKRVVDVYGKEKAYGIMAAIKVIMFGNMNGISLGNLWDRIRFKKTNNAKFFTDLYNGLFSFIFMPLFVFLNLFRKRKEFI